MRIDRHSDACLPRLLRNRICDRRLLRLVHCDRLPGHCSMVSHDLHVALGAGCAELIKLHVRQPAPPAPHPQPEAWPYNTPMPAGLPRLPEGAGNPAHGRAPGAATAATLGRANEAAMLPPGWRYARFGEPPADLRGMNIDVLV